MQNTKSTKIRLKNRSKYIEAKVKLQKFNAKNFNLKMNAKKVSEDLGEPQQRTRVH